MADTVGAFPADHPVITYADLALALGGSEDSFTGQLLRLIAKADPGNRARLRLGFPYHVIAWEIWQQAREPLTAGQLAEVMEWAVASGSDRISTAAPQTSPGRES